MSKDHTEVTITEPKFCDFCLPGTTQALYDGKTFIGPWANMCERHWRQYGIALGLGKGQRLVLVTA